MERLAVHRVWPLMLLEGSSSMSAMHCALHCTLVSELDKNDDRLAQPMFHAIVTMKYLIEVFMYVKECIQTSVYLM